jgi:hypothetical protein
MSDKNKNKKAKFQEGDYSDIDIKGIIDPIKVEIKPAKMPQVQIENKFKNKNDNIKPAEMPKFKNKNDNIKPAKMPKFKKKIYITVPRDSKNIKKFKGGGIAARGLGRAFMKGGKV